MTKVIMGVDPGSNLLGYSFLRVADLATKPHVLTMGVLDMRDQENHLGKLRQIFEELSALVRLYEPTEAAIEAPFYGKDAQAMLKLGRAQGVAMIAIATNNISVVEYSPRSVKQAVTGNGNASKEQLAQMLPHLLTGEIAYDYIDASDAVGVAYCHYLQGRLLLSRGGTTVVAKSNAKKSKKSTNWASFIQSNPDRIVD